MSRLRCKLWAKITAILTLYLLILIWAVSAIGVAVLAVNDAYFDDGRALRHQALDSGAYHSRSYLYQQLEAVTYPDMFYINEREFNDRFSKENSNYFFTVTDENGAVVLQNYTDEHPLRTYHYVYEFPTSYMHESDTETKAETVPVSTVCYTVESGIAGSFHAKDRIYYYHYYTELLLRVRYLLVVLVCALPFVMLLLLIFLCCAAGRHEEFPFIRPNALDRVPLDLLIAIMIAVAVGLAFLLYKITYADGIEWVGIGMAAVPFSLMLLLTTATRIKCGTLLSNTVLWKLCRLIGRLFRYIGRTLLKLPLYWKTGLIWAIYSAAQLFVFILFGDAEYLVFWIPEKLLVTPLIIWAVIQLQSLRKAAGELASGHIDYEVDTRYMWPVLKEHGTNLNHIGDGMQTAITDSLKSERMRMELISNVSHDIKTPLTSIINYVNLLKTEGLDSEQAPSYLDVLERQSWKLKKLTEDVIEASKATSGHIHASCLPLDSTILLQQALAEYNDRLQERSLDSVVRFEKQPLLILADGRLLWRVFDNVLSNIVKYAKSDTRVYVQASVQDDRVQITFKNISAAPLDIHPDELTERFVRGDRARHTDGSGLGLSIAKSLTELQGGEFSIDIDGDLFKVTISLPSHT